MIRVGKQLPFNTFAVYAGCTLVEVVSGVSREAAHKWAQKTYGSEAYVFENVQSRDITWEVARL